MADPARARKLGVRIQEIVAETLEMKLKDPEVLNRIAQAVAQGILRYKREYEKTEGFTR